MMEKRATQLFKRLTYLGYYPFEIKRIVQDIIGGSFDEANHVQRVEVIKTLEKYEKLGSNFVHAYSK